jgi:hypothetical protein
MAPSSCDRLAGLYAAAGGICVNTPNLDVAVEEIVNAGVGRSDLKYRTTAGSLRFARSVEVLIRAWDGHIIEPFCRQDGRP